MNFTEEQLEAITTRGGDILVSAAAGSGKTAVLSERIIDYIKKGGSIDRVLVVTFTNLAASEMKERIRKKLKTNNFTDQLNLIDNSKIMTMDAFYNTLLKENAFRFEINPSFNLIDAAKEDLFKNEVATSVISEFKNHLFLENFYNIKAISIGEEVLIEIYNFLKKIPFYDSWYKVMLDEYSKDFSNTKWGNYFYLEISNLISSYLELYLEKLNIIETDTEINEKLYPFILEEYSNIVKIKEQCSNKDYNALKSALSFEFLRFPAIKNTSLNTTSTSMKEIRNNLKKEIKSILNLFDLSLEEIENLFLKQKEILKVISEMIAVFDEKMKEKKGNYVSFDDIQNSVLNMLVKSYSYETDVLEPTDLAKEIKLEFDEILIDEYQDTNMLQDLIFRSISNDNLFLVGDVKQSIYGFRGSNPNIMINRAINSSSNSFPKTLLLSKNFRSRFEVLNFTNFIFENIMSKDFGSIDYNEKEKLYLGAAFSDCPNLKVSLNIINKNSEDELLFKKEIKEANFVALQIKELIKNGESEDEIAILLRDANSKADYYRDALLKEGISVYTEVSKQYFDQYEVKLVLSLLKAIVKKDKLSLVAVLRSPLFGISESIILENINNLEILFSGKLDIYRTKYTEMSLDLFINYLYVDLDIIKIMTNFDNGEERFKNLIELVNHAKKFSNTSSSLTDFIEYTDALLSNKKTLDGVNPPPSRKSVLITSIHKSKGLEFKHVFLPNLSKKFNMMDLNKSLLNDLDYFISFDIDKVSNVNSSVIKMIKKRASIEEEMRILYVALTRAREYLYLSAFTSNIYDKVSKVLNLTGDSISYSYLKNTLSYFDMILPVILKSRNARELVENTDSYSKYLTITPSFSVNVIDESSIDEFKPIKLNNIADDKTLENLSLNISFDPNYSKANLSVTDFNEQSRRVPKFINNFDSYGRGNKIHHIFEKIPFVLYNSAEFYNKVKEISDLDDKDINNVFSFFETSLYTEVIIHSNIHKEHNISFLDNGILIEGIIDLLCIYNNEVYIIDYKSDKIDSETLKNKYSNQLNLYEKAFSKKCNKYIYSIYNKELISI